MGPDAPFFREAGSGPGVICLHANASSSGQWRALIERLAPRFYVLAPDAHGAGRGPAWPPGRAVGLADEAALLEPLFERADGPCALVGHSHGAAVALVAALRWPERVRGLVLYEPTLFALVDADTPPPNEADGIRQVVERAQAALAAGDAAGAARHFIDYWMADGAWDAMPASRRAPIEASIVNVGGWAAALLGEPTPLAAFAALRPPVLFLRGGRSPASSLAVTRRLLRVLPHAEVTDFEALGHMGPVTDPEHVNPVIERFLAGG